MFWNDEDEGERLALNNPKKHSKIPLKMTTKYKDSSHDEICSPESIYSHDLCKYK